MTAKKQALKDIKAELVRTGKCFIAFQTKLNPVMEKLIRNHIKAQKLCQSSKKETSSQP